MKASFDISSYIKFSDIYYDMEICTKCRHARIIDNVIVVESASMCRGCYVTTPKYIAKNFAKKEIMIYQS